MKILILSMLLLFSSFKALAQDTLKPRKKRDFPATGALVAYYLWEEDSTGNLKKAPSKPFRQNFYVEIQKGAKKSGTATIGQMEKAIDFFAGEPGYDSELDKFYLEDSAKQVSKIQFPLSRKVAADFGSVIFRLKQGKWESLNRNNVLYFTIDSTGKMRYSHSSDTLFFFRDQFKKRVDGQFVVMNYFSQSGVISNQKVYNYENVDVTDQFLSDQTVPPARMLLFINGYRGPKRNDDPTDGLVTQKDRFGYWYKLDNQFADVLKPDVSYYVDGSLPIATSNHRTKAGFAWSYLRTKLTCRKNRTKKIFRRLNTEGNNEGFNERVEKGKLAGLAFLAARCDEPSCLKVKDTIDIVCHSMGYAYSLGFLEVVKSRMVLGNMYIIAPENACYAGYDWMQFQQVWQYGSNLDQEDADPVREQDGIAPQCAVKGLNKLPADRGGRAFIPKDWPDKNFIDSHMVYSYDWIFQRIKPGEAGFVSR